MEIFYTIGFMSMSKTLLRTHARERKTKRMGKPRLGYLLSRIPAFSAYCNTQTPCHPSSQSFLFIFFFKATVLSRFATDEAEGHYFAATAFHFSKASRQKPGGCPIKRRIFFSAKRSATAEEGRERRPACHRATGTQCWCDGEQPSRLRASAGKERTH